MKISRNELRRMILESLLREQEGGESNVTGAGAMRTKTDEDVVLAVKNIVKVVIDKIVGDESFNAVITVGKNVIMITKVKGTAANKESEIKQSLKDNQQLLGIRKQDMRTASAVKVVYEKEAKSPAATNAQTDEAPPAPSPAPLPNATPTKCKEVLAGATSSNDLIGNDKKEATLENAYKLTDVPDDQKYKYYVSNISGCWFALNTETCKIFSLLKYPKAMEKLDKNFNDARTDALKNKCKASTAKSTGGTPKPNPPSPSEPPIPSIIEHDGTTYYYNTWQGNLDRFDRAAPGFKKYINDNTQIRNERCLFNKLNNNILVYDQEGNFYNYSIENNKIEYPAPDATTTPQTIQHYKNMFNKILREGKVITKESYGKSHATLMRERYRRY